MGTRREILQEATKALQTVGSSNARLEAEVLLMHLLGESRVELYRDLNKAVPAFFITAYEDYLEQRKRGTPLQYLTGKREFMSLEYIVTPSVLIPRPETEILVEKMLTVAGEEIGKSRIEQPYRIVDLGTGSGVIAVSAAVYLPDNVFIHAVDVSAPALAVARENAARNGVETRITFHYGDLFGPLEICGLRKKINLIASNPPYIPTEEITSLEHEVKGYEPLKALDGGKDGLEFYRRIIERAPAFLCEKGWLFLEVGYGQAEAVKEIITQKWGYPKLVSVYDLSGIERVVCARFSGNS